MSVWERLNVEKPFMVRLFGGLPDWDIDKYRTGLMIVDMQNYCAAPGKGIWSLAHEQGMESELQYYYERLELVTHNLARLLQACRDQGVQVIHVNGDVFMNDVKKIRREVLESLKQTQGGEPHRSLDQIVNRLNVGKFNDDIEVIPPLQPLPTEPVIRKMGAGPFGTTIIDQVLRSLDIKYLIIGGAATHQCVEMTIRGAFEFGYHVIMVEDGTATVSEELQRNTLIALGDWFCKVKTTDEILAEILC